MKIIVNGQQAFGKAALEAILAEGTDEVVAVYTAPDKEGRPPDPMVEAAQAHGLTLHQPPNFKESGTLDTLRRLDADLMVMAYVTLFVPAEARDAPKLGSICFHPSLLPKHRGPSSINWPIIAGATETGLTYFWPDDGLDEGDILLQKSVTIGPDDTLGTVYFDKIFPLGVAATLEAINLVRAGDPPRIPQDESQATYESWCKAADAEVDWSRPIDDLHNLIRGTDPQPGAWTTAPDGSKLQLYGSTRAADAGAPGTILMIGDDGMTVACGDGSLRIQRVRPAGGGKQSALEWCDSAGLAIEARLGGA